MVSFSVLLVRVLPRQVGSTSKPILKNPKFLVFLIIPAQLASLEQSLYKHQSSTKFFLKKKKSWSKLDLNPLDQA